MSQIPLFDLIMCLSNTTDLVSPTLANHQQQVAYIASGIAAEMGLSREAQSTVTMAGALHDFGALSLRERLLCLDFEVVTPHLHSESAYLLLQDFEPFHGIAEIIRHHHLPWNGGAGTRRFNADVPQESHILHCADRVSVLLQHGKSHTQQLDHLHRTLAPKAGTLLNPDIIEAFFELALKNFFWFDLEAPTLNGVMADRCWENELLLEMESLTDIAKVFGRAIDFRSRFTAVHSSGAAAVSEWLATQAGMTASDCRLMRVAGHMHDFGKLAISNEILDKPGPLSEEETYQMRKHPYYAHRLLHSIPSLRSLNQWISFHHERLDGKGYPFCLGGSAIPTGARILAVGDIFTALTEDRPYRPGMPAIQALRILQDLVTSGALDGDIVALLNSSFLDTAEICRAAQHQARQEFQTFTSYLFSKTSELN